jgi:hypothetical protein
VSDAFADDARLYLRSILPLVREVRPNDQVQGGVALRAYEGEVWVHPYLFRQVCRNGAVVAWATQSRHVEGLDQLATDVSAETLREAVRACCAADAFTTAAEAMRTAADVHADSILALIPLLSRWPAAQWVQLLVQIEDRFRNEGDLTRFGLMNAVTSLARDTRDPDLRWRLEELGGGVPVATTPTLPDDQAAAWLAGARPAPARKRRRAVTVG